MTDRDNLTDLNIKKASTKATIQPIERAMRVIFTCVIVLSINLAKTPF